MQSAPQHPVCGDLRAAVERACQPTTARYIIDGRERIAALPRVWVLENIEQVGRDALNFADYWEYGRFLEALEVIGATELIDRIVTEGLCSPEFDVRDMAKLWRDRRSPAAG